MYDYRIGWDSFLECCFMFAYREESGYLYSTRLYPTLQIEHSKFIARSLKWILILNEHIPHNQLSLGPLAPCCRTQKAVRSQGLVSHPGLGNFAPAMVAGSSTSGAAHAFGKLGTLILGSLDINHCYRLPLRRPGRCSHRRCRRWRWFVYGSSALINITH